MIRRPPRLTRTYTPVPYPKLFRSPHKNTAHPCPGHAARGRKVRRYRSQLEAHPRHDHAAEMVVLVIAVREIIDPAIAVIVGQVGAIERQFDMLVELVADRRVEVERAGEPFEEIGRAHV